MRHAVSIALVAGVLAGPAQADETEDLDRLIESLRIEDSVQIMRAEGLEYGAEIAAEMLPGVSQDAWAAQLSRIYNTDLMAQRVSVTLRGALRETDITPLSDFMTSATGQEIMALEISAREAFLDPATEDAAFARYEQAKADKTPLYLQVRDLIADSTLVDYNVMGALNANLMFYRGLEEGDAVAMSEADILSDVWAQEKAVRAESEAWLGAFLMMAYRPLENTSLEAYADFYRTAEGQVLNAAIFKAYDGMYADISYLLGRAVAQQMTSEDL